MAADTPLRKVIGSKGDKNAALWRRILGHDKDSSGPNDATGEPKKETGEPKKD